MDKPTLPPSVVPEPRPLPEPSFLLRACNRLARAAPSLFKRLSPASGSRSRRAIRAVIAESGMFDAAFYAAMNPDVVAAGVDPLAHYVTHGASEGRQPHPDFDPKFYAQYTGTDPRLINPLIHFITVGRAARTPTRPAEYIPEIPEVDHQLPAEHRHPLSAAHVDGRDDEDLSDAYRVDDKEALFSSGLFDPDYYLERYRDVARAGVDAVQHYLKYGAAEGRFPNRHFDSKYYSLQAGIDPKQENPLLHYIAEGERRGIRPNPDFDPHHYLAQHPEAARSSLSPLLHLLRHPSPGARWVPLNSRASTVSSYYISVPSARVLIVVPVYNGTDHLRRCVDSIIRHTKSVDAELLLIDDASTDETTRQLLEYYSRRPQTTVLRNDCNQGFTRTINRGFEYADGRDVVILNSDTVVTARWLENLVLALYSGPRIATATPLSDNAGAFSTPSVGSNPTHDSLGVDAAARLSRRAASVTHVTVPTGHGFCMIIRHAAIEELGGFDAESFPRGYGEENDFCLRARERGWKHVIALNTYVAHVNGASFGSAKASLCVEARRVLDRLHPEYGRLLREELGNCEELSDQRNRFNASLRALKSGDRSRPLPRILFVIATRTGGTPQTNADLMEGIANLYECFVLHSDSRTVRLIRAADGLILEEQDLDAPVRFPRHESDSYDDVVRHWLRVHDIELVHVRHIAWHSTQLAQVARSLGIFVVFSFHDFYCICPSVNLTNGVDPWMPDGVVTPRIVAPLWEEQVERVHEFAPESVLAMWKRRMGAMLAYCDAFVTTSEIAKEILVRNLPILKDREKDFHIIPHGRDFDKFLAPSRRIENARPFRILVPGNISASKGLSTIQRIADACGDAIELHVVGRCPPELACRVHHHGEYEREDFQTLIEEIQPSVALILSIWPETYCHTLTECWAAGVPVIGSELGAVGERLKHSGAGWLVDPFDVAGILRLIDEIRRGRAGYERRLLAVEKWQSGEGQARTVSAMASDYLQIYRLVSRDRRTFSVASSPLVESSCIPEPIRIGVMAKGTYPAIAPSAYVRVAMPIQQAASNVIYDWLEPGEILRSALGDFDGLLLCRDALDARESQELLRQQVNSGIPIVIDLDDDLLAVPRDKDTDDDYAARSKGLERVLRSASAVTVSTHELSRTIRRINPRTHVIHNTLDRSLWCSAVGAPTIDRPPRSTVPYRVLYMGSKTHGEDLDIVLPVFKRLQDAGLAELYVIGVEDGERDGYRRLTPPSSRYPAFVEWLRANAGVFDVAVAPLQDTRFNRQKSALKYMEYAAMGLPVIASRVSPYVEVVRDGIDGLLVDNSSESWERALRDTLKSPRRRALMGRAAFARAQRDFVSTGCAFDSVFRTLLQSTPSADAALADSMSPELRSY